MTTEKLSAISRLDIDHFNYPENDKTTKIRRWFWSLVLRLAIAAGRPVILVGAARTGKTRLLDAMFPTKDHQKSPTLVVDDCQPEDALMLKLTVQRLAVMNEPFCLATQRYMDVRGVVDTYRAVLGASRVLIVVVGGKKNPHAVLQELPQ